MKSSKVHSVLSEVYRLVGDYTAGDFDQASNYKGIAPPLRDALRALAREASSAASWQPTDKAQSPRDQVDSGMALSSRADPVLEIARMIRQARRFSTTQSILQFAKEVGLSVPARPKESRERLARRMADSILMAREPRRSQIVAQLTGNGDSQTQGWIDAIKNSRP